jgi:Rho-associated protein kinase 2
MKIAIRKLKFGVCLPNSRLFYSLSLLVQRKQIQDPGLILDLDKVFHVRSVTHGDVIRADAKDIPKIFQVLYAGEGEARKPEENGDDSRTGIIAWKGHEFLQITYHMPANCEVCMKPIWHMFRPPPALECRRCHIKLHKEHWDKKEEVAPCKINFYDLQSAKELLLLTTSAQEQQHWVSKLSKKVQKGGYKAHRDRDHLSSLSQEHQASTTSISSGSSATYPVNKSATLPPSSSLRSK